MLGTNRLLLVVLAATAVASPLLHSRDSFSCTSPRVRKEWSNLSKSQQTAYLDAEICLFDLPAQTTLRNVTSRYSDLIALHQNLTDYVHFDGVFLPWHRYFLHAHETLLRNECNYTGPIP